MPASDQVIALRQALRGADLLWTYIRVGYQPDVVDCFAAVDQLLDVTEKAESLEQRDVVRGALEDWASEEQAETGAELREPRDIAPYWLSILKTMSNVGADFQFLPFIKLRKLVNDERFFENNDYTGAELDGLQRVSIRWFRHEQEDGNLYARLMGRSLSLSPDRARTALHSLDGFAWRTPPDNSSRHLHEQGTFGASDLRVAGTSDGIIEFVVTSRNRGDAERVLLDLVGAFASVVPALPTGGIRAVVRAQLEPDHVGRTFPKADFWRLNPPGTDNPSDSSP